MTATDDGIQLNDPQTLYRRWEDGQWNPFAIDLARDREQWEQMDDGDRGVIYWVLSSLMVAEERITTKFSGLVGAHGSEEEASFLATQQVDEARHMQFYARVQDEVIAQPAVIAAHVERARQQLSPAFGAIFDVALVQAHEQLVAAPDDLAAKVRFVTIYHLILEATLGLTSFRFVTGYLEREGLLPGFVEGYSKIHHDETRHIGYGVWFLRETVRDRPEQADTVRATLRELLPSVAAALTPPDRTDAEETDWDALGANVDEIRGFALDGHQPPPGHHRRPARQPVTAQPDLLRRALAEALAAFALVFAGCGAIIANTVHAGALGGIGVSATFGLVIMAMIYATGHLSGAHINPAVTIAFTLTRHFPPRDALTYIAAQIVGAAAAAFVLLAAWPAEPAALGATVPSVGVGTALLYEVVLTAFLMFVIVAVATDTRAVGAAAALAIGGTVGLDALFGGPITGASMNPARSFGPALASGTWTDFWIYLVGPIVGAALGALAYQLVRGEHVRPAVVAERA